MLRDEHPSYRQNYERLGIEVVQGSIQWPSGHWMKGQINVTLRVWGIGFPKLGLKHVWQHYVWTLYTKEDQWRCLEMIGTILTEGDVNDVERELLKNWSEMVAGFKPYTEEDLFGCGLQEIGLNYDQSGDDHAEHDAGWS